ncbi:MAG: NAD-glutamate dehydrogenase [Alphaproteobacteria bacterium]|nr:NAD-glutamate dehydrogenase [Alphaproteobacteria bacterium]
MKALTGLSFDAVTPQELMRALLKSPADLLWFGGIGTFIKAVHQSHGDAGDRANDAIRVDAPEVRAKVIGEGANLGVTQAGRIAFAQAGGRINTDAIDNSAGVDTSDHEVNLKILLNAAITENALTMDERDAVLSELTDSVAAHVLLDNYEQTLALSIAQANAPAEFDDAMRMIHELERRGKLNRAVEGLPNDDVARERAQKGEGLTRPELAVLLAYAKLTLFEEVIASDLPDDPAFAPLLAAYFPPAASARFAAYLPKHRLKREIIGTVLVNRLVNEGGPLFMHLAQQASGAGAPAIVRAYGIATLAFGIDQLRARINALDGRIEASVQIAMHHDVVSLLQRQTLWMLRNAGHAPDIAETAALYGRGAEALKDTFSTLVSPIEFEWIDAVIRDLREKGVPHDLAEAIGILPVIAAVTDIVRISADAGAPIDAVAGAFFEAGEAAGIDRLRAAAAKVRPGGHWDRLALQRIGDDLNASQRALASLALRQCGSLGGDAKRDEGVAAVKRWTEGSDVRLAQARALIQDLERSGPFTVAKLMLAVGQLRDLAQG